MRGAPIAYGLALLIVVGAGALSARARSIARGPEASAFDVDRVRDTLSSLVREPRPVGSAALAEARAELVRRLEALGLEPSVERRFVCTELGACGEAVNVVAELPGVAPARPLILAAHLDTVAASPGAHDDALGVAILLEVARRLLEEDTRYPRRRTILLFDDGEEVGLLGARAFAERHPEAAKGAFFFATVDGMAGPTVFRTKGPADASLLWSIAQAPAAYTRSTERLGVLSGGFDDTDLFSSLGVPSVTVAGQEGYALYHTRRDRLESVSRATIADRGAATWALVQASFRGRPRQPVEGAYGDVFGRLLYGMVGTWRAAAGGALALLLTLVLLTGGAGGPGLRAIGAAALRLALVVGLVAGARAVLALAFGPVSAGWALFSAALLSVAAALGLGPRRGDDAPERDALGGAASAQNAWPLELQVGLLTISAAAVVLAVCSPRLAFGATVVAIAGGAAGLAGFGLTAWGRARVELTWAGASFFAGIVAADQLAAWSQLAPQPGGPLGALLAVAAELPATLLFAGGALALRRRPSRGAAGASRRSWSPQTSSLRAPPPRAQAAALAALGAASFALAPRPEAPKNTSLRLVDEGPGRPARVAVFGETPAELSPEVQRVARLYPWSSGDYPVDVVPTDVRAPFTPEIHTATTSTGARLVVRVPPGTAQLRLAVAPETPAAAITVEGVDVPMTADAVRWTHGWRLVTVHGPPPELTIDVSPAKASLHIDVGALVPGLPEALTELEAARPEGHAPANIGDVTERRARIHAEGLEPSVDGEQ